MCFITPLNNNKFHIKVYLVISSDLDFQPNKGLGVPSRPMFPYVTVLKGVTERGLYQSASNMGRNQGIL